MWKMKAVFGGTYDSDTDEDCEDNWNAGDCQCQAGGTSKEQTGPWGVHF